MFPRTMGVWYSTRFSAIIFFVSRGPLCREWKGGGERKKRRSIKGERERGRGREREGGEGAVGGADTTGDKGKREKEGEGEGDGKKGRAKREGEVAT